MSSKHFVDKRESSYVKPFNCRDEFVYMLVGEVIRSALVDYMRKENKKMPKYRRREMLHDKGTAQAFFRSSNLFKAANVDFEYLKKIYEKEGVCIYGR